MKRLLFILIVVAILLVMSYLSLGFFEPVEISWGQWQIQVDALIMIIIWVLSIILWQICASIFTIPKRIRDYFQNANTSKSLVNLAAASFALSKQDYQQASNLLSKVHAEEIDYHTKLLQAYVLMQSNDRLALDKAVRHLLHRFPHKQSELYGTYSQWLLKIGDSNRAFDMIQAELEANPENRQTWHAFLELSEQSNNFEPWIAWQNRSKPLLNKDQHQRLEVGVARFQMRQCNNAKELQLYWQSLANKLRQHSALIQVYVDCAMTLQADIQFLQLITTGLKNQWDEQWLWRVSNYRHLKHIHELIEWLRQHHPLNAGECFYLAMAVLCCRQQLWAIGQDFLRKIPNEQGSNAKILLDAWIIANLENKEIIKPLQQLMLLQGMGWAKYHL